MNRITAAVLGSATLALAACSGDLGVGLPECEEVPRRPTSAILLSVQAVPSAEYAPCLDEIPLGWDEIEFTVERGMARFTVTDSISPFLTVTLTPACEPSGVEMPSPLEDVDKRASMAREVGSEVRVSVVPTGDRPLVMANAMVRDLDGSEVEGRLVHFEVDADLEADLRSRVNRAFFDAEFVWIIDELDVLEGTVEVRRALDVEVASGVSGEDALDRMERFVESPRYEGTWYFTFVGGCITYEFAAGGRIAERIEQDVATAVGFYDLDALRALGRRNGIDLEQAPPP